MEENEKSDVVIRRCVIKACTSRRTWCKTLKSYLQSGKLFFRFPMDAHSRSQWINAVSRSVSEHVLTKLYQENDLDCYICEDHFNLSRCMLNYDEYLASKGNLQKILFTQYCVPDRKLEEYSVKVRVSKFANSLMEHDYSLLTYRHGIIISSKNNFNRNKSLKRKNKPKNYDPSVNIGLVNEYSAAVESNPELTKDADNFEYGEYYFTNNSFQKISDIPYSSGSETQSIDLEIIQCDFCVQEFCYKSDLLKHVQEEHLDIDLEKFHCNRCPMSFTNEDDCMNHIRILHDEVGTNIPNFDKTVTLEEIKLEDHDITKLLATAGNVLGQDSHELSFSNNFPVKSTSQSDRNIKTEITQSINPIGNTLNREKNHIQSKYLNEEMATQSVETYDSMASTQELYETLIHSINAKRNNFELCSVPSKETSKTIAEKYEPMTSSQELDMSEKMYSQEIYINKNTADHVIDKPVKNKIRKKKTTQVNKETVKCCFIPTCNNNNQTCPHKIFFPVPRRSKRWYEVANRLYENERGYISYCCEDHFDFDNDVIFKGNLPVLKRKVLPHKANIYYNIHILSKYKKRGSRTSKNGQLGLLKTHGNKSLEDNFPNIDPNSVLRTYSRKEPNQLVEKNDSQNIESEHTENKNIKNENMESKNIESENMESKNIEGENTESKTSRSKYKKTTEIKDKVNENTDSRNKGRNKEWKTKITKVNQSEKPPFLKELVVELEAMDPKLYTSLENGATHNISSTNSKEKDGTKLNTIKEDPHTNEGHTTKAFDLQMFEKHEQHFVKLLDGMARMRKKEEAMLNNESKISVAQDTKDTNDIKIERRHSDITKTKYIDVKADISKATRKSFDLQEFEKHEQNYENILNHNEDDDVFDDNALLKPYKIIKEEVINGHSVCLKCPVLIPHGHIMCRKCKEQQLINAILIDRQDVYPNSIKDNPDKNDYFEIKDEFQEIKFSVDLNTYLKSTESSYCSDEDSNEEYDQESEEQMFSVDLNTNTKPSKINLNSGSYEDNYQVTKEIKSALESNINLKLTESSSDEDSNEEYDQESEEQMFSVDLNTNAKPSKINLNTGSYEDNYQVRKEIKSALDSNINLKLTESSSDEDSNEEYDQESEEQMFSVDLNTNAKPSKINLNTGSYGDNYQVTKEIKSALDSNINLILTESSSNEESNEQKYQVSKEIKFAVDLNTNLKSIISSSEQVSTIQNDQEPKELANSKQTFIKPNINNHKCEPCQKEFKHYKRWHEHVTAKHGNTKFTCYTCENTFNCRRYLVKHVKKHHSTEQTNKKAYKQNIQWVICSVCGTSFKNNTLLKIHVKNCHSESAQCELCHSTLKSESYLKSHLRRVHGVEMSQKCESCGKVLRNRRQLFVHVRNNHPETLKACAYCSTRFNSTKYLERHMKICSNIPPPPLPELDFEIKVEPAESDEDWCIK